MLHDEAVRDAIPVSLATVYNTLHQFTGAGLLREVAIEGAKTYFDTNTSDHYHFYFEHDGALMDVAERYDSRARRSRTARGNADLAHRRSGASRQNES